MNKEVAFISPKLFLIEYFDIFLFKSIEHPCYPVGWRNITSRMLLFKTIGKEY